MDIKKQFIIFFLVIFLGVFLISKGGYAKDENEIIYINYSIFFPDQHGQAKAAIDFAKTIEKRTKGRVSFTYFTGGHVSRSPHIYDGVVKGVFDMGNSCFAYNRGRFPVMEAVDLPMGYPSGQVATHVANAYAQKIEPPELNDVKLLYVHAHGPGYLHTKKPIILPKDLKGTVIRSTGLSAKIVKACAGTAIAMTQSEAYMALKENIVDGTMAPISTLKGYNQSKAVNYTTEWTSISYTTAMFVVMNLDTWNSLPIDIQKIFQEESQKWIKVHGKLWDTLDQEGRTETLKMGNKIISLTDSENKEWEKAIAPVIQNYIDKTPHGREYIQQLKELIHLYSEKYCPKSYQK
ncbi:MAG TPA: TRAP transporter substrate-binding protein [Desulfohalobiaceae bacterium]|nr:TRAP transporter substrate-binding protein [Desulfohalobiaceae bacterium]